MKHKKHLSGLCMLLAIILISTATLSCTKKINEEENSMKLRYISFGHGTRTMIVLPGLSTGFVTDDVAGVEGVFSDFLDDYTVYLFDPRDDVPEDYSISRMGDDVVSVIKGLGLSDLYMYGCSMGGMECIYIASQYPELVKKIAVASSSCKANETSDKVVDTWVSLAKEGKKQELTESMGRLIYSDAVYEANKEVFASMADALTDELTVRFINTASTILGLDLTDEAKNIKCPVFVLGSLGDNVLTFGASVEISKLTGGELCIYGEEYSHAVYDQAPDLRLKVKAFFDGE